MQGISENMRISAENTAMSACVSVSALNSVYSGTVFAVPFFVAFSRFYTYFYYFIKQHTAKCRKCFG